MPHKLLSDIRPSEFLKNRQYFIFLNLSFGFASTSHFFAIGNESMRVVVRIAVIGRETITVIAVMDHLLPMDKRKKR